MQKKRLYCRYDNMIVVWLSVTYIDISIDISKYQPVLNPTQPSYSQPILYFKTFH